MARIHFFAGLLAVGLAVGCKAQTKLPGGTNPALNRQIEVMVRSQYNIPPDYNLTLGARKPSSFAGYEELPITLTRGAKQTEIDFLISSDGKTLARLEKFDLANNPMLLIDVAGRPVRGNPAAKVTVVNFDDLECPYCARMHETLFPATLDRYKGLVRFIYKDMPLVEIHPWAMHASVDANCLAAQSSEAYWTYVDYVHAHGQEVNGDNRDAAKSFDALNRIARQEATLAKLDDARLDNCLAKQDETQVRASMKEAEKLGVEGTPALFVDGERYSGALPQDAIWAMIDRALRSAGVEPPPMPAAPPAATRPAPAPPSGSGK